MTKTTIRTTTIELVQGDITVQAVDAIVNAANSDLVGGGGVDGAIHRAAGAELMKACQKIGRCPTGGARITEGYQLPAKYVIHAVGPIYTQHTNPADLLASAYHHSLQLAHEHGLRSVAFSAISTGVYAYPMDAAARIALNTAITYIEKHQPALELVRFVLFTTHAFTAFSQALTKLRSDS
ncbi:MAG: O-acetyl-ADP-ribose deacetylase [Anaerolineae bacterium]